MPPLMWHTLGKRKITAPHKSGTSDTVYIYVPVTLIPVITNKNKLEQEVFALNVSVNY